MLSSAGFVPHHGWAMLDTLNVAKAPDADCSKLGTKTLQVCAWIAGHRPASGWRAVQRHGSWPGLASLSATYQLLWIAAADDVLPYTAGYGLMRCWQSRLNWDLGGMCGQGALCRIPHAQRLKTSTSIGRA
jgi:hypothetical protein